MPIPASDIHYLGIRHHGPGSAARLLKALDELQPDCVLIEGPADCSELLPLLAENSMHPPVALLAYAADNPEQHIYYPFTDYSPEYQACLWAIRHQATLAFIDLPINILLAARLQREQQPGNEAAHHEEEADRPPAQYPAQQSDDADDSTTDEQPATSTANHISADPFAVLAQLSGYRDGESWWHDFIEQNHDDSDDNQALFTGIGDMMAVLRESSHSDNAGQHLCEDRDEVREAFMRLQIADQRKQLEQSSDKPAVIAVVCGAWHVPALQAEQTQKADKAQLKTLPKKIPPSKVKTTWIPWTSTRLAKSSGYGAGVSAPMWYQHLWDYRNHPEQLAYWVRYIAHSLREQGKIISTASIIETVRLSHSLASVRGRPAAGFEEIIDATIACLCFGEPLIWQQIASLVLLGNRVGEIPDNMPLAPLLEDLQRQQKQVKLKPGALNNNLALDLRSELGSKRSLLLHRLQILNVPWGTLMDSGRSRGTFRENWQLQWHPEYSVQLVENLVYGNSIEQAANNKLIEAFKQHLTLDQLASKVQLSLTARLDEATSVGLQCLDRQAAHNSDALSLLGAIVPLVQVSRYGTARHIDLEQVQKLVEQLVTQASVALPYACRNLDADEADHFRQRIKSTHSSILLAELPNDVTTLWWQTLATLSNSNEHNSALISGLCTHLLYQAQQLDTDTLQQRLKRTLSPAISTADAAAYFDGFFSETVQQLQYNQTLLSAVEDWLMTLPADDFTQYLPLFKRVFSDLDRIERHHLLQKILGKQHRTALEYHSHSALLPLWQQQQQALVQLFSKATS